jgi:TP901 family phage tail tape measure protein
MELGESAEIAATTMKTFGMAAAEVPKVADALAAGAGKAVGSVHELGYALKMSGLVASQLGMSMTDTVGTLSAFAQNALKGSDAGTSLKSMLTFLQPKSDAAATAMEDLGLKFYDAQGKFIGITGVAGQLQSKLSGLTDEQRMSTMTTIFGTDAIRAANILYREGAGGIQKWIDAVEDQGYAARVAALSQQNLKGDIEKLGGAIETALITSGGGGAAGLRHLTQAATATVNAFGALPSPVSNTATVIGLVAGAAGLAAAGFLKVVPAIAETKASLAAMNITAATSRARLRGVAGFLGGPFGAALAVGTLALGTWITRQQDAAEASQALRIALDQQTGAMTGNARQVIQDALAADQPKSNFLPNWAFPGGDTSSINARAKELGISLHDVQLAAEGSAPALAKVRAQLEPRMTAAFESRDINQAEKMRSVLDFLADSSSDVGKQRQALLMSKDAMTELGGAAGDAGTGVAGYADATGKATAETDAMVKAQEELASALDASNNKFLSGRAAERDYQASLDDASAALKGVTEAEKHNGKALDEHSAKGRKNQEVLDGLASTSLARLQAVLSDEGPGRKFEQTLASTRAELIQVAHRFGMTKTAAKEYAAKVLDIPKKAMTDIRLKNAEKAKRQADELYSAVRSLPKYKTITLTVKQVFENYGGESAAKGRYAASGLLHRATGGQIPADAGTPGKDSVHALLSPGEYVVNQKATRAHLPLLEAINTGRLPGYATGGQVGARAASTVTVTAPQVVMVPVQETHTTAATVHVGTVYTRDAQSFLGWGQRRSFDATAGIN